MIKRFIIWLKSLTYCRCQGYRSVGEFGSLGDFYCKAENSEKYECEDCLCNGGIYNPDSGKKDYITYFLINYKDLLKGFFLQIRFILRGKKDCWDCKHTSYYDLDENNFTLKCRRVFGLIKTVKWTGYCIHWRGKND